MQYLFFNIFDFPLLPSFSEISFPRNFLPSATFWCTFGHSSAHTLLHVNLNRPWFFSLQVDHFHTWHVSCISSSKRYASQENSWHRREQSRLFLRSTSLLWQSCYPWHSSSLTESVDTQREVATPCSVRIGTNSGYTHTVNILLSDQNVEETAIAAYWVTDSINQCCVGFLPLHCIRQAHNFDGHFVQVVPATTAVHAMEV